jgi:hypothetical protein
MTIKIEVITQKDNRYGKQVLVTTKDKKIIYEGKASKELIKTLDGAKYAYFIATMVHNPDTEEGLYNTKDKTKINLDLRLGNQGW